MGLVEGERVGITEGILDGKYEGNPVGETLGVSVGNGVDSIMLISSFPSIRYSHIISSVSSDIFFFFDEEERPLPCLLESPISELEDDLRLPERKEELLFPEEDEDLPLPVWLDLKREGGPLVACVA